MIPYGRQSISPADVAAVVDVLQGDWLTTGPWVSRFEQAITEQVGGHPAVSCTSGTAALHIAYAAIGVRPGDEVVTTPMTFVATASSASLLGARIVFADIDPETALIDPASVESVVNDRTRVVAAVDYAGQPADYHALGGIAAGVGAITLADAAHSVGGRWRGRPVGDLADVTTLSFFPTKNITTGEGGAVVARDPAIARRAHEFRGVGLVRDPARFRLTDEGPWHQEVHAFGLNYRLTDIASALGLAQLARLRDFSRRRAEIVARYDAALQGIDGIRTIGRVRDAEPVWHLYPIRVLDGRRRAVFEAMRSAGFGVQVNYIPAYWHPVYSDLGYRRGLCPHAEDFYAEELSLPLYPDLTDDEVDQVVEALVGILR